MILCYMVDDYFGFICRQITGRITVAYLGREFKRKSVLSQLLGGIIFATETPRLWRVGRTLVTDTTKPGIVA